MDVTRPYKMYTLLCHGCPTLFLMKPRRADFVLIIQPHLVQRGVVHLTQSVGRKRHPMLRNSASGPEIGFPAGISAGL